MYDSEFDPADSYEINMGAAWDTPGEGAYYHADQKPDENNKEN